MASKAIDSPPRVVPSRAYGGTVIKDETVWKKKDLHQRFKYDNITLSIYACLIQEIF